MAKKKRLDDVIYHVKIEKKNSLNHNCNCHYVLQQTREICKNEPDINLSDFLKKNVFKVMAISSFEYKFRDKYNKYKNI